MPLQVSHHQTNNHSIQSFYLKQALHPFYSHSLSSGTSSMPLGNMHYSLFSLNYLFLHLKYITFFHSSYHTIIQLILSCPRFSDSNWIEHRLFSMAFQAFPDLVPVHPSSLPSSSIYSSRLTSLPDKGLPTFQISAHPSGPLMKSFLFVPVQINCFLFYESPVFYIFLHLFKTFFSLQLCMKCLSLLLYCKMSYLSL